MRIGFKTAQTVPTEKSRQGYRHGLVQTAHFARPTHLSQAQSVRTGSKNGHHLAKQKAKRISKVETKASQEKIELSEGEVGHRVSALWDFRQQTANAKPTTEKRRSTVVEVAGTPRHCRAMRARLMGKRLTRFARTS